jgi:hypothetical protein
MERLGAFELIIIIAIIAFVVVLPIFLLVNRSKHKARANALDDVLRQQNHSEDKYEKLERLNKLRANGALN